MKNYSFSQNPTTSNSAENTLFIVSNSETDNSSKNSSKDSCWDQKQTHNLSITSRVPSHLIYWISLISSQFWNFAIRGSWAILELKYFFTNHRQNHWNKRKFQFLLNPSKLNIKLRLLLEMINESLIKKIR
jgi:hypothetical protein